MFLEKHSRFLRLYDLRIAPRHSDAAFLPLEAGKTNFSVRDGFEKHLATGKALVVQPNGDIVELMKVSFDDVAGSLVLLFHRASPNAAEPSYRKKAREEAGVKITLRQAEKAEGEEQAVSAHLVIGKKSYISGRISRRLGGNTRNQHGFGSTNPQSGAR